MSLKITRNNLIIGLAAFLLIVNLLVLFNLDLFYIRAVLAFIFIIAVPGLLIMLSLKIRVAFWEYLVYTIGLSISFIMFAGLAVNWILPWLNITDRPLDTIPIIVCFDIFLIVLGFVAYKRNKDLKFEPKFPKLDLLNNIFFIIPMFFPVMAILGAFILNNGGPNYLTMGMLGGIAVYVLAIVIFRDKLNENVYPWALWLIGLSLLLMWSMSSYHVSGWDSHQEYLVFKLTDNNGLWSMDFYTDAYNSCISLNILPKVILDFIKINPELIFKFFMQIIFSTISIILFMLFNKIVQINYAFLATFFFFSNVQFIMYSGWIRQEIALLLFSLVLLLLFESERKYSTSLIIIFGFSMIISHYSTTYIALSIFAVSVLILSFTKTAKSNKNILRFIILIAFSFLWMSQITGVSAGLIGFAENSLSHFDEIASSSNKQASVSLFNQLNILKKSNSVTNEEIQNFSKKIREIYSVNNNLALYSDSTYSSEGILLTLPPLTKVKLTQAYAPVIFIYNLISLIPRILLVLGLGLYLIFYRSKNKSYLVLAIISLLAIILITVIPFASINYSARRLYQQLLIILSPLIIFPFSSLDNASRYRVSYIALAIFLVISFSFSSGMVQEYVGGFSPSIQLSTDKLNLVNLGLTYNYEFHAAQWFGDNYDQKYNIYGDQSSSVKLKSFGTITKKIYLDVFSNTLDRNAYVFSNYLNVHTGKSQLSSEWSFQKREIFYIFPTHFLNNNKNKIYNNGGSEIFK